MRAGVGKYKVRAGTVKYRFGDGAVKYKLGPGARARAGAGGWETLMPAFH